ncbi:hypothetical protein Pmar_PMAR014885 [Perkinsus marinus ATCC 50983]|uniref:Uncharacterized protein n=1 Tax=Perkinsus marinus (strain ATCC 50983 / TXsc) TaxID=423536 RepID=C5L562_PERM5|nr:hypothetical protein Pmar_PMAR014885 [Perkinsus marinus ATCC 50983]EER08121.1 hypothetical protein Pmar_PMAR014885 [Perkinsus marinus ATCC 50983]|eukprot:XP_002776305.1 hypothetical protein Pmar_PMAR014885 [Perkinsus marinus ATCC 50983]
MSTPAVRNLWLSSSSRAATAALSGSVRSLQTSAPRFYSQDEIDTAQNFFQLMMEGDITGAAKLAEPQAKRLGMNVEEFMAKQASERAYLIYRFSSAERQEAIKLAMDGEGFDQGLTEAEREANTSASGMAMCKPELIHEILESGGDKFWLPICKEHYERIEQVIKMCRTSLSFGDLCPAPTRDYQLLGRSYPPRIMLGKSGAVLQTYISRLLAGSRSFSPQAMANHEAAAQLFDSQLRGLGPADGPLEKPDADQSARLQEFKEWAERREEAARKHQRLLLHLTCDVSRYMLEPPEGRALMELAKLVITPENQKEQEYTSGVIQSTLDMM